MTCVEVWTATTLRQVKIHGRASELQKERIYNQFLNELINEAYKIAEIDNKNVNSLVVAYKW